MSAKLNTITPIEETESVFAIPHTFEISHELHAQAVEVAAERARNEERAKCEAEIADLKWALAKSTFGYVHIMGNDDYWTARRAEQFDNQTRYEAIKSKYCAAAMNARETRTLALGD